MDADRQIIVATMRTNIGVDVEQVVPMLENLRTAVGVPPEQVPLDAGYRSAANPGHAKALATASGGWTQLFLTTVRMKHGETALKVPGAGSQRRRLCANEWNGS